MVTEWVRDLVVVSLTFAFVEMLLPANNLRRFARVVMGVILIAVIINSVFHISSAMDDALESQAGFAPGYDSRLDRLSWTAKGERITYAGLDIVEGEAERRIASQVESIARLASGADEAYAGIEFTSQGDIRRIDVTLKNLSLPGAALSENRKELAALMEKRVINAIQEFYGFSSVVAISVSVDFRQ